MFLEIALLCSTREFPKGILDIYIFLICLAYVLKCYMFVMVSVKLNISFLLITRPHHKMLNIALRGGVGGNIRALEYLNIGTLEYRSIGVLEHQSFGALESRSIYEFKMSIYYNNYIVSYFYKCHT